MGSRHLTCVFMDGKYVVAQYGQWRGTPDMMGYKILEFLVPVDKEKFRDRLRHCRFCSPEERKTAGDDIDKFLELFPLQTREWGGEVLQEIYSRDGECVLKKDIDCAGDSQMLEWAYVVDFDKRTLEVFKGDNRYPLTPEDRFYGYPVESGSAYFPVKLVKSYPLDDLEETTVSFVSDLMGPSR